MPNGSTILKRTSEEIFHYGAKPVSLGLRVFEQMGQVRVKEAAVLSPSDLWGETSVLHERGSRRETWGCWCHLSFVPSTPDLSPPFPSHPQSFLEEKMREVGGPPP